MDIRTRVIIDYMVTDSVTADISGLYVMVHRLSLGLGMFCLDSAYLAREMCDMISAMGMVPRIKPKSNTVRNAKGSQAWRRMVDLYMDDRGTFDSEYRQRSIIESVFAALKKMYGDHAVPQAGQPGKGDLDPRHMPRHRARSQITGKRRQAHTGPNRNTSSVTGASDHAPFLAEPPYHVLDLEDFMGYGRTWHRMTAAYSTIPVMSLVPKMTFLLLGHTLVTKW